ncbi:mRNA turnover 4 [Lobosporangium transversale]|uniref:Ribosome assembly factor mrt4 n=1 Tax=Lobosporangium transversale TaxID=64571 RepID=A0A1Y2GXK6_9FUNG|nr:ribosomal protein L10-domain-containing protein [Lobosporangium transversale]KAF9896209.1 mRNA turnover 4 [Lobosporangium transversale]ORZ24997.1 ribosomal protein L10-domain-containing protein [Lobosporangium transversale]|eukprot:XP_021883978.1 ribosomal protein L10-domain-containing protein [Lobosporangium transversale]
MPKSKRNKIVTLTQTDKKGRAGKDALYEQIRECVDKYKYIWIFSVENMRNTYLKNVRAELRNSRFFFGRTKVMAKALGTSPEDEHKDNLHKLAEQLVGHVGLLFTNQPPQEIQDYFANYTESDYARSGVKATSTFVVPAGPVYRGEEVFPHNMEPQLRSLGMPTVLNNGIVTLNNEYRVCKEGQTLTPEQAQLLKLFMVQMADFHVTLKAYYKDGEIFRV